MIYGDAIWQKWWYLLKKAFHFEGISAVYFFVMEYQSKTKFLVICLILGFSGKKFFLLYTLKQMIAEQLHDQTTKSLLLFQISKPY